MIAHTPEGVQDRKEVITDLSSTNLVTLERRVFNSNEILSPIMA